MRHLIILCLCLLANQSYAQLAIDTSRTASERVAEVLLGNRVKLVSALPIGHKIASGVFRDSSDVPLVKEGLVFSTGIVYDIRGPNTSSSKGRNLLRKGDRSLYYISTGPVKDASGIVFTFIPEYETISFNYFFGSEEYVEYVGSNFNDIFALLIKGPGYDGYHNLATIPGSSRPITINNINPGRNSRYYIDNNYFNSRGFASPEKRERLNQVWVENFQLDGFTKLMQIEARVQPGKQYTIKIVIADVNDAAYDSAVFLEAHSFTSLPMDPMQRQVLLAEDDFEFVRAYEPSRLGKERPQPGGALLQYLRKDTLKNDIVPSPVIENRELPVLELAEVVTFGLDVDRLNAESREILQEQLPMMQQYPHRKISVVGYTCNLGNVAYNQRLARRRAEAVRDYLIGQGIAPDRIVVGEEGEEAPRAPNTAELNRELNRRVEVRWAN